MRFVWDPEKEKLNIRRHKVNFTESCHVFADPYALNMFDEDHSENEDRWITLGQIPNGKTLLVIHTYRELSDGEEVVRIISARKANKNEVKDYIARRK